MPRALHRLTARTVATLSAPGRHADGGNLYLRISATGSKGWVFLFRWHGKPTELGFGSIANVTLLQARNLAAEARQKLAAGENPREVRQTAKDATFKAVSERLIAAMRPSWRSAVHAAQWEFSLFVDAKALGHLPVETIRTQDILAVLQKPWATKIETASRLRGRIERVLDFAKAEGLWPDDKANPARWRGHLDQLLPKRKNVDRDHHAAMPYGEVAGFVERLRERPAVSALALEFIILTAARAGEATGARWSEFDREKGVWTIPATRMKKGREHRVPLPARALAILATLQETRTSDFVFPGVKPGQAMSAATVKMLLYRMRVEDATTHGFRSAFRDWASETTSFPHEVCEAALAHAIGNRTEAAYRRGDLLEKRRQLMEAWANHCVPRGEPMGGKVLAFQGRTSEAL